MNELQIFNNEKYGEVRTAIINNEPYFMLADVCRVLEIQDHKTAKRRLSENGVHSMHLIDRMNREQQATFINESNLYKLAFTSRKKEAEEFTEWVTSEVLPSIRKHGGYLTPAKIEEVLSNPDTIIKLATELKKLKTENQMQAQQIAEFKPIKEYVDIILQSTDTVTITQIAADYGLSAKKLNKILNEEKIQHKVNDQWILYSNMMNKGYTKSETIDIERSDGRIETKMYTRWTQKGRLKIHEILTNLGFIANYDREQQKLFA